ncbi:MAG: DUF748 domain-containing protein [bacterium]|nr:DUF748 domain-containing protein [bacterium]
MRKFFKTAALVLVSAFILFFIQRHLGFVIKKIAVPLVKKQLSLDIEFDEADINLFAGRVYLTDLKILKEDRSILFKTDRIIADLPFRSFFGKEILVKSLTLCGPEIDLNVGGSTENSAEYKNFIGNIDCSKTSPTSCFFIDKINISNGKINFYDGRIVQPPHLTVFDDISFDIRRIGTAEKNKQNYSDFNLKCAVNPENGGLCDIKGSILLWSDKYNFDAEIEARKIDLIKMKPYYGKKMFLPLKKGYMSIYSSIKCRENYIESRNTAVFESVEIDNAADLNTLIFGFPSQTFMEFLKNEKGTFKIEFAVSGDISNPKFDMEGQFADAMSAAITSVIKGSLRIIRNVTEKAAKVGAKTSETAVNVGKSTAETAVGTTKAVGKSVADTLKSLMPGETENEK